MKIGEKIKRVRLHRHMKQRELGELVGFTDGAANRIAQYESGFRVPKEDMVKKIAAALNVAECALLEPDTGNLEGIMETLFWLDEDIPDVLRCSLTMPFDKIHAEADSNIVPIIHTNARTSPFNAQPTMLWSENDLLNCLFNTYAVCSTDIIRARSHMKSILSGSCNGLLAQQLRTLLPCLKILTHCSKTQTRINPSLGTISLVRIFL